MVEIKLENEPITLLTALLTAVETITMHPSLNKTVYFGDPLVPAIEI